MVPYLADIIVGIPGGNTYAIEFDINVFKDEIVPVLKEVVERDGYKFIDSSVEFPNRVTVFCNYKRSEYTEALIKSIQDAFPAVEKIARLAPSMTDNSPLIEVESFFDVIAA